MKPAWEKTTSLLMSSFLMKTYPYFAKKKKNSTDPILQIDGQKNLEIQKNLQKTIKYKIKLFACNCVPP